MLQYIRFSTAGESHGKGMLVIVEGVPAGVPLQPIDVARDLARRQLGYGRGGRMAIEKDAGEILSGVRLGETLGSPIAVWIRNRDHANWEVAMSVEPRQGEDDESLRRVFLPRPGHADLVGMLKYDRPDARDILERASARETSARVAAGAVARRFLGELGVSISSHVTRIGPEEAARPVEWPADVNAVADDSELRCLDPAAEERMKRAIDEAREAGDTLGGVFEVTAAGLPVGLGSHVSWDRRLDGRIAGALMSIQAMKGVEIGLGFESARRRGSEVHDEIINDPTSTRTGGFSRTRNHAGGLEGGTTTGELLVARVAMKPLSSLTRPLASVDVRTGTAAEAVRERSDVCAVPAAAVVGEAMVALVLADAAIEKFGGDSIAETRLNLEAFLARSASRIRQPE
ncbi:MAG: chorismate synthase [Candidatus Palauibacterales bacterium]|nr:chorismate synthase [Candidatus Palauibacterales bacterium]MDP2482887.1 chorismate synthase [Candidatus Palauibacterales bacterium]